MLWRALRFTKCLQRQSSGSCPLPCGTDRPFIIILFFPDAEAGTERGTGAWSQVWLQGRNLMLPAAENPSQNVGSKAAQTCTQPTWFPQSLKFSTAVPGFQILSPSTVAFAGGEMIPLEISPGQSSGRSFSLVVSLILWRGSLWS